MRSSRLIAWLLFCSPSLLLSYVQDAGQKVPLAQAPVETPKIPEALTPEKRGDIFMARKMYREAIDVFLETRPMTAVVLNKIGIAYHQLNDLASSRKYYEKAIKLNPEYAEAINNLGTVFYAQKNYRRAISSYRKALKYAPKSASIYSNLGTAYFARKQYEEATQYYQKALELNPEVFENRGTQGVLLQERTIEERAKFHYYLAKLYANAGQNELALQYIRKSLEEGFKDRKKYLEESDFAAVRALPDFDAVMKSEPRVL
jgi:tetratricopeptide (TPR) repeat protein